MAISTYVTLESELQFYILEISVEVYLYYGIKQWKHGGHSEFALLNPPPPPIQTYTFIPIS